MKIAFKKLSPLATMPFYASEGAAGMDLYAAIEAPILLKGGERVLVPTGISVELPPMCCAFVLARSGLSSKFGIALANGVGLIDNDYRGEIGVALFNSSAEHYTVRQGERIAQLCIMRAEQVEIQEVQELSETNRGEGGFGSTGK